MSIDDHGKMLRFTLHLKRSDLNTHLTSFSTSALKRQARPLTYTGFPCGTIFFLSVCVCRTDIHMKGPEEDVECLLQLFFVSYSLKSSPSENLTVLARLAGQQALKCAELHCS